MPVGPHLPQASGEATSPDWLPELLAGFRDGRRRALARAISAVEDEVPGYEQLLDALYPATGRASRLGVTGPPGAGKSTLTTAMVARFRARNETVGIVAVDPTSPFTGGALLGDRIRMGELATDPGVFIRSTATRGSLGGLALTSGEVADVVDAFGFDRVLLETVGVGQSELDIAAAADTTIVVLVPESGDAVQAMKAGLMEISDVFVVNKADRPGAERLARDIRLTLALRSGRGPILPAGHHGMDTGRAGLAGAGGGEPAAAAPDAGGGAWDIPVVLTSAESGRGTAELVAELDRHAAWLAGSGELKRRRRDRLRRRVRQAVERELQSRAWESGEPLLRDAMPELEAKTATPYAVAARIVRALVG
jgi:GTPase